VDPPRDKNLSGNDSATPAKPPGNQVRPAQPEVPAQPEQPTRPTKVRAESINWPDSPRIDLIQPAANRYNAAANRHIADRSAQAPPRETGRAAIQADVAKARNNQPSKGQTRQLENVPPAQQPKGKAGVEADKLRALQKETQQKPPQDKGRGR